MSECGADIVNQLLFNELFAIPDTVKNFAYGNRRNRMLTDEAEALLIFSWRRIFHPEQTVVFNAFAKAGCLNGSQTMVHVMQQMFVKTKFVTHCIKQFWRKVEVLLGRPQLLFRPLPFVAGS